MLARARTALTDRLSLSAMAKMFFPASAIFRSCSSSSGFQGRLALRAPKIISPSAGTTADKDGSITPSNGQPTKVFLQDRKFASGHGRRLRWRLV
jgi:hypothetical protein